MPRKSVSVIIDCIVHDEQALWRAAYGRYEEYNGTADQSDVEDMLGTEAEPNLGACLQVLLRPGAWPTPEAFEIEMTSAEDNGELMEGSYVTGRDS